MHTGKLRFKTDGSDKFIETSYTNILSELRTSSYNNIYIYIYIYIYRHNLKTEAVRSLEL